MSAEHDADAIGSRPSWFYTCKKRRDGLMAIGEWQWLPPSTRVGTYAAPDILWFDRCRVCVARLQMCPRLGDQRVMPTPGPQTARHCIFTPVKATLRRITAPPRSTKYSADKCARRMQTSHRAGDHEKSWPGGSPPCHHASHSESFEGRTLVSLRARSRRFLQV